MSKRGTLKNGEPHPSVNMALEFLGTLSMKDMAIWRESFASCAIEGNRLAEICLETMRRISDKEPVSDRYLLGLAFAILHGEVKK